ncbi:hypothetical protein ASG88_21120 [Nocardioides sp. Soil777]|nr:hypothetical protein ASG88_21120 [Nocardioides sp. Soil777]
MAVEASWEMNEPSGATTMTDSGPNGLHAPVDQSGLDTGFVFDGATGYSWPRRSPTTPPASPERVIVIPDNPSLDPRTDTFTVEIRYRTKEKFGNITQKGQSASPGGQWKIQNPGGLPSCLYKGSLTRGAVRSPIALNDNAWHVLRCVKTPTAVELWVDGVRVGRKLGAVGTIDNKIPMTIGGKINCDQITVTCDYFSGQIDYVRIYRGS